MDKYERLKLTLLQAMADSGGKPILVSFGSKRVTLEDVLICCESTCGHRNIQNHIHAIELLFEDRLVIYSSGADGYLYTISALGYDYLDEIVE